MWNHIVLGQTTQRLQQRRGWIERVWKSNFELSLVEKSHTLEKTTLGTKKVGDHLNLEVDMIAKYIENFLRFDGNSKQEEWAKNFFDVKYED